MATTKQFAPVLPGDLEEGRMYIYFYQPYDSSDYTTVDFLEKSEEEKYKFSFLREPSHILLLTPTQVIQHIRTSLRTP